MRKKKEVLSLCAVAALVFFSATTCFAHSEYTPGEDYLLTYKKLEYPPYEGKETSSTMEYNYTYEIEDSETTGLKSFFLNEKVIRLESLLVTRTQTDDFSSVECTYYTYESDKNGIIERENLYDYTYELDENGVLENLYGGETLTEYVLYEYDKDGNLTAQKTYDGDDNLNMQTFYEYDQAGNQTKMFLYQKSGLLLSTEFEYDAEGNILSQTSYNSEGIMQSSYTFEHNQEGKIISAAACDSEGTVTSKSEYVYDAAGNNIKTTGYNENGEILFNYEYAYVAADEYESSEQE